MRERARITWVGHGTVLIELDDAWLMTDPVLGRMVGPLARVTPPPSLESLRPTDVVLLSHLHGDHADLRSLRRLGKDTAIVAPPGAARWLGRRGFTNVFDLGADDSYRIGEVTVTATPAHHDGRRYPWGPTADTIGFLVHGSRTVYYAGDTDLFDGMAALEPHPDVALLPISGWGPTLGPGHLDPQRAAQALRLIDPRVAIPIHWGTLSLPWLVRSARGAPSAGSEFARLAAREAPDVEVRVLRPGEQTTVV